MGVCLHVDICAPSECLLTLEAKSHQFPCSWSYSCELTSGFWELNSGALEELPVL